MNDQPYKIITQGNLGSFHFEAIDQYFKDQQYDITSADSFLSLAKNLSSNEDLDFGVMAIENSIAGSIIANYKILREHQFRIVGEIYLPIHHNFMVLPGQSFKDISEVRSHPMALNQCLHFLNKYPHIKHVVSNDTASSAKLISTQGLKNVAAIASKSSAQLYGLYILAEKIQTSKINYTRFFILQTQDKDLRSGQFNKASIYLRTAHYKGSLLKVLKVIYEHNINLSKVQSYPIEGDLNKYYFYLDLEFDKLQQYENAILNLEKETQYLEVLGVYKNGLDDVIDYFKD